MHCGHYETAIQELVDGTLGPLRRAELELHLEQCEGCRALAEDLRRIRTLAGDLEALPVPDGAWQRLSPRLQAQGLRPAASGHHGYALLAIAASLTLAVGVSLWLLHSSSRSPALDTMAAGNPPPATSSGNASTTAAVQGVNDADSVVAGVEEEFRLAEQHYQNAIARLEEATRNDDGTIDPQTAATLQKSLLVIDQAIAESRAALRAEPLSVSARETLFGALRRKVALLQDTIAIMNEMRKGNAAAVARIVDQG
jgi:Putative zinc-finger